MKLSRAIAVALCLMVGIACVWAAQAPPTQTPVAAAAPAAKPAATPAAAPAGTPAPVKMEFKNDLEKASYAIGCQLAMNLKSRRSFVDVPMVLQGFTQVLNGQTSAFTDQELQQIITGWSKDVQAKLAEKGTAESKAFLEANAKKEGVKTLPSGLQYKVIKEGTGNTPTATDKVKVQYKGTLIDGTEFDSSYKRGQPAEFQVGGVIPGWVEALQLMKEGSKWELYLPPTLAYGEGGRPSIPPNSVLIFEVELLEIAKPAATPAANPAVIIPPTVPPAPKPQ